MLVLGPNSTCDVCLECYTNGANVPHAITCGHVFCQKCLDHLMQYKCPLCRERFSPRDIRKLHVDQDDSTKPAGEASSSEPVTLPPQIDNESQRLLDDITRIVKEGGKINEIRRVIEECRAYYKSQPGNQYTPVRVSCLLLHNLLEAQRKQGAQAEQLREAVATRDEIHDRLTSELGVVQVKYEDLVRTSRDEKDTALAIEKSLREHYDQMNNFWKSQMASVNLECRSLREELDRLRLGGTVAPTPRAVELQYFYRDEPKRSYSGSEEVTLSQEEKTKGKVIDDEYDLHLSPLAEVTAPLLSTAPSLMALADDSDEDMAKLKRVRSPIQEEPEPESELEDSCSVNPFPAHLQPQTSKIDPIPIPMGSRTPPSRQPSAMAMSITVDQWTSGISVSRPRDDVVMNSRPPSPIRRSSSDRIVIPQGPRPSKDSLTREMTELKRRDSAEMATKDPFVSKLHDLLDSPRPTSSLHAHMQRRGDLPEPALPRPISRLTTPSRPPSSAQLPGSSSTSVVHYPEDPHGALDRKPLVRASDAAMQLEKERQERQEKERRRLRETPSLSGSLKDTTNAPSDAYHLTRNRSIGGIKTKGIYQVAPTDTFA